MNPRVLSPPLVLQYLRDQDARLTVGEVARHFGANPARSASAAFGYAPSIWEPLERLKEAGLVFMEEGPTRDADSSTVEIVRNMLPVLSVLGISLTEQARRAEGRGISVTPLFGRPSAPQKEHDLFVLSPFTPRMRDVFESAAYPAAEACGLVAAWGPDHRTPNVVMTDVWNAIFHAKVILADCTASNPNVLYEIGIAHVVGTPTILMTQEIDQVPFDLRHLRVLEYDPSPAGLDLLARDLESTIRELIPIVGRKPKSISGERPKPPPGAKGFGLKKLVDDVRKAIGAGGRGDREPGGES